MNFYYVEQALPHAPEVSNVYKEVVVDSYFSKVVKDKLKDYNDIIENYCNKSNKVKVNNFCN